MTAKRSLLVAASVLALMLVAAVGILDGFLVAAHERRNEGGWTTGWSTLEGLVVAAVLAIPLLLGGMGALLSARHPRGAGACLLLAGLGALLVGVLSVLGSVGWGMVALPAAVICTLAYADLTSSRASMPLPLRPGGTGDTFAA
jgi:hypothetical protein